MKAKPLDPYAMLGVERSATLAEVKAAFRAAAKLYHPDVAGTDPATAKRWTEIQDAYNLLLDPDKRAKYDSTGEAEAGHYSSVQIDSIAADNVGKLLDQIIDTMFDMPDNTNLYAINPLDIVAAQVRETMAAVLSDQRRANQRRLFYERMRLVIQRKMAPGEPAPADDPVLGVLDATIEEIKLNQTQLANNEKINARMSQVLQSYEFTPANGEARQLAARMRLLANTSKTVELEP